VALHDTAIRRNRYRIVPVALLGALNYWVAAVIVTICTIIGTSVALMIAGIFETDFWEAGFALIRLIIFAGKFLDWSTVGLVALAGFVAIGTVASIVMIVRHLRGVERQVLTETRAAVESGGTHREVENLLSGLAVAADIPPPRFAVVNDAAPNSFAVGRKPDRVLVGVTTGLIDTLTRPELEAVLAYEISRVASWDIALSTWAVALTGKTVAFADEAVEQGWAIRRVLLFIPTLLGEWLRDFALRGQAEQRDMLAVRVTRNPQQLLDALEKLERDGTVVKQVTRATAPLWLETPNLPSRSRWARRFAKEPSLVDRIAKLRELLRQPPSTTTPAPG
jgi:heat shock protein HtpX